MLTARRIVLRSLLSVTGVALLTFLTHALVPVNPTTAGFAYLILVLLIAGSWGFIEASLASVCATLAFNFYFFPPFGTLTIADPQNWVALLSFLATALVASRLSAKAELRAREAIERQQDVERLYSFSRAILLIDDSQPFAKQLAGQLVQIFELDAVQLYDRRTGEIYAAGPSDFDGLEDQLRDAAARGVSFSDADRRRVITAVRLGSEPIASIAIQGSRMPDAVLQGISNLVAIGLERARTQDLARQMEVVRRSEQLRTTLVDAMAHEFKTPLTSIKAATTSLLSGSGQPADTARELLTIADEEATRLGMLIDDSIEMARLDTGHIELHLQATTWRDIVSGAVSSIQTGLAERDLKISPHEQLPELLLDRRLMKLAVRQLLDNALKYSPPETPLEIRLHETQGKQFLEVTDHGPGIPVPEQKRIFDRFYRSPSVKAQVPGSGLGLSISDSIVKAHGGELTVESEPGRTTFRITIAADHKGDRG